MWKNALTFAIVIIVNWLQAEISKWRVAKLKYMNNLLYKLTFRRINDTFEPFETSSTNKY